MLDIASPGHLGALLDAILLEKVLAHVQIEFITLTGHFHEFSDHSEALRPIERRVFDLCLEGEVLDCRHVEVFHLE